MYLARCEVESGQYAKRTVFHNFVVSSESPDAMRIFFQQMGALGMTKDFWRQNPSDDRICQALENRRFRATTTIRQWQGEDRNNIGRIKPAAQGRARRTAAPAAARSRCPTAASGRGLAQPGGPGSAPAACTDQPGPGQPLGVAAERAGRRPDPARQPGLGPGHQPDPDAECAHSDALGTDHHPSAPPRCRARSRPPPRRSHRHRHSPTGTRRRRSPTRRSRLPPGRSALRVPEAARTGRVGPAAAAAVTDPPF